MLSRSRADRAAVLPHPRAAGPEARRLVMVSSWLMQAGLPRLRILPLEGLILHEEHDNQRALPLVEKLRAQGILRNPPVVMPLKDGTDRYMVLDGANRVTSLREMEFPHLVAQVVETSDPNVSLRTWKHLVWNMKPEEMLAGLRGIEDLSLEEVDRHRSRDVPDHAPLQVQLADDRVYLGQTPREISGQVQVLRQVVDVYKDRASMDRTSQTLIETFKDLHPALTALLIFPRFEIPTVLKLAGRGSVLPPGITRFTASPRALHLNYPLHELSNGKPLAYKQAYLERWIEDRVASKGVRHYAEATYLFDE